MATIISLKFFIPGGFIYGLRIYNFIDNFFKSISYFGIYLLLHIHF
jgi:hypothetical protein